MEFAHRTHSGAKAMAKTTTKSRASSARPAANKSRAGKTTTDHEKIREWAEQRDGSPATVKSTARGKSAGILRIDFPDYRGAQSLQKVSWDKFFDKFDKENLAFLYQEKTAGGRTSRFCKFVERGAGRE
jgi:hypothetical protein